MLRRSKHSKNEVVVPYGEEDEEEEEEGGERERARENCRV
jgi:hypothetical protein